jgi:hypothetical protein
MPQRSNPTARADCLMRVERSVSKWVGPGDQFRRTRKHILQEGYHCGIASETRWQQPGFQAVIHEPNYQYNAQTGDLDREYRGQRMRANLRRSLFCLLSVCSAVDFAARSARADAEAGQMSAPTQNSAAQSVDAQSSASEDSNI